MIKRTFGIILLLAMALVATAQQPTPPKTNLKVGDAAPDFTLPSTVVGQDGKGVRFKLSDFKGKKNVVLAFYVLAFTGG
jgi:cytochrome oxidase Cu insertion factor (SCO1/SenC/PrrC family)